jgi:hypothetical protein
MFHNFSNPAPIGAGTVTIPPSAPLPERFERLPVNLSPDEIKQMIGELLG